MRKYLHYGALTAALLTFASPVSAQTIEDTDGSPLPNQIYGIKSTGTIVYGSAPSNGGSPNVRFTADTEVQITEGFAQINDADYKANDASTHDWYNLIINPDAVFTDMKFSVQLVESGEVDVRYLLTGSMLDANVFGNYTQLAGSFDGGRGNVNQLLTGGLFDGLLIRSDSPIELFETKQMSYSTQISAVPEPATWAMMLAGFGAVGIQVRRRRRRLHLEYA